MHLAEALLPVDDAVALARSELERMLERNQAYYDKVPRLRPNPSKPRRSQIRADDAWYFIPFDRGDEQAEPVTVRVNGLTRTVVIAGRP